MLPLYIQGTDFFDEKTYKFITVPSRTIQLEHSLISISRWESKWKKPFLGEGKTREQTIDYIKCMTLTPNVDPMLYSCIGDKEIKQVQEYIDDPMTATWFKERSRRPNYKIITSEKIYGWMVQMNIPFECEKWHLARLLVLLQVCDEMNQPPKKRNRAESAESMRKLNAARRGRYHTRG